MKSIVNLFETLMLNLFFLFAFVTIITYILGSDFFGRSYIIFSISTVVSLISSLMLRELENYILD